MHILPLLAVLAAAPADLERGQETLLVMKLRPIDVDEEIATSLTHVVTEHIAARSELRVVSAMDIDTMVSEQLEQERMGCLDEACLAEMTRAANARFVVSGTLGKIGAELVLNLSLVDAVETVTKGRSSRTAPTVEALTETIEGLVADVFGWEHTGEAAPRYELPEGEEVELAVLDIEPVGIEPNVAENLTQLLAGEIKKIEGTRVTSRADIQSILALEGERDRMGCLDDVVCMAEIGGALGVSKLVVGHAGTLAESYIISLRLIDTKQVRVDSRVTETFKGQEEQLLPAVRRAGRLLLGIEDETPGGLALSGPEPEAAVFLDDQAVGMLPLPPIPDLPPGRHSVRVEKDGFFTWRSDVYVEPGATTPLWAGLEEEPARWYQKWWVWTVAGVVVVGAVSTAIYLGTQSTPDPEGGVKEGTTNVPVSTGALTW